MELGWLRMRGPRFGRPVPQAQTLARTHVTAAHSSLSTQAKKETFTSEFASASQDSRLAPRYWIRYKSFIIYFSLSTSALWKVWGWVQ